MKTIEQLVYNHASTGKIPKGWHPAINFLGWQSPKGKRRYGRIDLINMIYKYTCIRCGLFTSDIRYLRIGFFYDLTEVSNKFEFHKDQNLYIARYCKDCRADFMSDILQPWMEETIERDESGF